MSLHDPENFAKIVRGMIDIQKHEGKFRLSGGIRHSNLMLTLGWLPECRGATQRHYIQGGSSEYRIERYCYRRDHLIKDAF